MSETPNKAAGKFPGSRHAPKQAAPSINCRMSSDVFDGESAMTVPESLLEFLKRAIKEDAVTDRYF